MMDAKAEKQLEKDHYAKFGSFDPSILNGSLDDAIAYLTRLREEYGENSYIEEDYYSCYDDSPRWRVVYWQKMTDTEYKAAEARRKKDRAAAKAKKEKDAIEKEKRDRAEFQRLADELGVTLS